MESDADLRGGSLAGWLRFSTLAADLIADFCLVVVIKPGERRLHICFAGSSAQA